MTTKEIIQKLNDGIQTLCCSDEWENYLKFFSKFHHYSYCNCILIYLQRPDATLVKGLKSWNQLGGHIRKGSKAIRILAPHTIREKDKTETTETEEDKDKEHLLVGFHPVCVYDISDVDGIDMPEDLCRILTNSVDDYTSTLDTLIRLADCPVSFENIRSGANGYFSRTENRIVVQDKMPEEMTIKTLIHEIAHSRLHRIDGTEKNEPREIREIEAESIAFVMCQRIGIDSGDFSYGYLAGWGNNQETDILKSKIEIITKAADSFYDDFIQASKNEAKE